MESLDQRLSAIRDKGRQHMADARDAAGEAARLFCDIVEERPLLVIVALAAASYLVARFGSIRMLGTAAELGGKPKELSGAGAGI